MENTDRVRRAGMVCVAAAALWIVSLCIEFGFGLEPPGSGTLYSVNQSMFHVAMSGFVVGIVGLIWARAAGNGWFGTIALGLFALAWSGLIVDGVLPPVIAATGLPQDAVQPIFGLTATFGAVLSGIAVAVAQRWAGWQRFVVLANALCALLVLGVNIASVTSSFIPEVIWGLSWRLIGLALVANGRRATRPALA